MREIKFRGLSLSGEFVFGFLADFCVKEIAKFAILNDGIVIPIINGSESQYTGMKDANGVEIYEGDIVTDEDCLVAAVKFCTEKIGSCGCCYPAFDGSGFAAFGSNRQSVHLTECTVIGNIYQNPELLK